MSLQRIFSSTTIIVGLFISVDYGLCDEFRCRGRETSGHTMSMRGSWGIRAVWTFVYVLALAAFTMFFTILERLFTTGVNFAIILFSHSEKSYFLDFMNSFYFNRYFIFGHALSKVYFFIWKKTFYLQKKLNYIYFTKNDLDFLQ